MATAETQFRIRTIVDGLENVDKLKNAVRSLNDSSAPAAADLNKLKEAATALGSAAARTEKDLKTSIDVLKTVRSNVSLTDAEYQKLTRTINEYSRSLEKANTQGNLKKFGQTAGAVAASGVFGGPEGFIGATIGGIFGGPAGALAGGAVGAQVGQVRQTIGETADYAATVDRLNIALKGVAGSQAQYALALRAVAKESENFNLPIDIATRSFTRLAASVIGAGGKIQDAEAVFHGVSAAIKATGGSAEDVDGALLAMSQVFSKGRVQGEELVRQLGDRLPGAVTLFAHSTGRSTAQLSKDLQAGIVDLNDLMTFVTKGLSKYDETAQKMARSQEDAGARMSKSLGDLKKDFGEFFKPVGAGLQDIITKLAQMADEAAKAGRSLENSYTLKSQAFRDANKKFNLDGSIRDLPTIASSAYWKFVDERTKQLQEAAAKANKSAASEVEKLSTFEKPKTKDDAAAKKAAEEAAKLKSEQQQLDESLAKSRINLDDAVFKNRQDLIRKTYEFEQELINKQQDNWAKSFTGAARGAADMISGFLKEIQGVNNKVTDAQLAENAALQKVASTSAMAAVTGQGLGRMIPGGTGYSGKNYYELLDGIPGTAGYRADHAGSNAHVHFGDSNSVEIRQVADYLRSQGFKISEFGQYGQAVGGHATNSMHYSGNAFDVPGSQFPVGGEIAGMSRVVNAIERFLVGGASGKLPATGVADQQRRDVSAEGSVAVAGQEALQASKALAMTKKQAEDLKKLIGEGFVLDFTQQIRQQTDALQDQNVITAKRNQLQLAGEKPEIIDAEIQKTQALQQITHQTETAQLALEKLNAAGQGNSVAATRLRDSIKSLGENYNKLASGIDDAAQAQVRFNEAMKWRQDNRIGMGIKDGAAQYVQSIGTMRQATASLTETGVKGLENALTELATTGKTDFRAFAASILADTARMIIQQMVLRTIMQAIGAIGGGGGGFSFSGNSFLGNAAFSSGFNVPAFSVAANGNVFAANGIIPYAMGGIVNRPTLFPFANGTGLMGEAGPEAIIPLKRGADGRLGVSGGGGGGTTVNVSVDAKGTNIQGNGGQSAALGRAIAASVQAELIKQKRPGGLLAA